MVLHPVGKARDLAQHPSGPSPTPPNTTARRPDASCAEVEVGILGLRVRSFEAEDTHEWNK